MGQALPETHWRTSMFEELTAPMCHGTWELVPPPNNCKPKGCKWVFSVKRKANGSVDCFKARLIAKGFNQHLGLGYKETFSHDIKPTTIRTILTVAMM